MFKNYSHLDLSSWTTLSQYQFVDFIQNQTIICPIRSQWIHFEEYLFSVIGLIVTNLLAIRIHFNEIRFRDFFALFRCHLMNFSLTSLFLLSFLFNRFPSENSCRCEQIFLQFFSTILIGEVFLLDFYRLNTKNQSRWLVLIFVLMLLCQTFFSSIWWIVVKKTPPIHYHRQMCFHRIQIDLCFHAQRPLLFPTIALPFALLFTGFNVYHFTRPFAIAQLLEAILASIGLIMSGSMWYMNLFCSDYPQMPYRYVAYVFLLTFLLPRIWISQLERSRITVEEVKPLLHDEVQFHNGNCRIRFPNDDDDDDDDIMTFPPSTGEQTQKPVIRTMEMPPGQIFRSTLEKSNGAL